MSNTRTRKASTARRTATRPSGNSGMRVEVHGSLPVGNPAPEEIAAGVHWVGVEDETDSFRCNPYIIVDGAEAVLIDPGGLLYADAVIARIRAVVDPSSIRYIVAQHQDPDVCSMLNALRSIVHPDCEVVCHGRMSVLIKHLGAGFPFWHVEDNDFTLTFGGRTLTFAHTPYLHSPGAIVTYDRKTRTAFTSDIFGGITKDWDLYAPEDYLDSIMAFHVDYMPSKEILATGIKRIRQLGKIRRIAPQHGSIVEGDLVDKLLDAVESISVGTYADELFAETIREQAEATRMKQMVENASFRFMAADAAGTIVYMNPSAKELFRGLEHLLPCKADDMIGKSFDIFHARPEHQRGLIAKHKSSFPMSATAKLGDRTLRIDAFGVYDDRGEFMGPAVIWEDITDHLKLEERDKSVREKVVDLTSKLAEASQTLRDVSLSMSGAAEETSSQASTVSGFSGKVADNINMVVTSLEEMAQSIAEISRSASLASSVTMQAVESANRANEIITKLGNSSVQIGKVTRVISSIAQQTNLLALNATIEAARAGETGRGFAVVANAVKELAKKTAHSTDDIAERIEAIQADAADAVESIEEITGVIAKIKDVSATIAAAVEEQSVTSSEISGNMSMAASGMQSITENVIAVAEAAEQTSGGASDTLNAAMGLNQLAADLEGIVREF